MEEGDTGRKKRICIRNSIASIDKAVVLEHLVPCSGLPLRPLSALNGF
jgi:hypothetical protein